MTGPLLIMIAAALWALDGLLRTQLTLSIPAVWIVFIEHVVGLVLLSPLLVRHKHTIKQLQLADWLQLLLLAAVSSVLGTILFTTALASSFAVGDFATPILLQKLQPIFVIILAAIVLKERLSFRFLALVPVALAGSYLISFGAEAVPFGLEGKMLVYVLAVSAALAWGSGTILSKRVLRTLPFALATALRFLLAVPVSLAAALYLAPDFAVTSLSGSDVLRFVIIAFTTGAGAILIYYRGLKQTPARVATIAELVFPVVTILIAITSLNPYGAPQILSIANGIGIVVLLGCILAVTVDPETKV